MPRQPTRVMNEAEVLKQLGQEEAGATAPMMDGLRVCPDDVLLPFADRPSETRELLFKPINKGLLDLLKSDKPTWHQVHCFTYHEILH